VPLVVATIAWSWYIHKTFQPLSTAVCLSSVCEVERGEEATDIVRLREGHPVTWSQSNLSRRRYAQNDETLYVAPEDERTDYSQPPMANWYHGVLNTGKRRYGHPAFTGVLPEPWLPLKKGQTLANGHRTGLLRIPIHSTHGIVLSLRNRYSMLRRKVTRRPRNASTNGYHDNGLDGLSDVHPLVADTQSSSSNPWADAEAGPSNDRLHHRLSFDPASGVIMLPEGDDWLIDDEDSSDEYGNTTPPSGEATSDNASREDLAQSPSSTSPASPKRRHHTTYYHHPERRRSVIPGAFPS